MASSRTLWRYASIFRRFRQCVVGGDEFVDNGQQAVELVHGLLRLLAAQQFVEALDDSIKVRVGVDVFRHGVHLSGQVCGHGHQVALGQLRLPVNSGDEPIIVPDGGVLHEGGQLCKLGAVGHDGIEIVEHRLPGILQSLTIGLGVGARRNVELQHLVGDRLHRGGIFTFIKMLNGVHKKEEAAPAPEARLCPFCRQPIADDATRCPHCTSELK